MLMLGIGTYFSKQIFDQVGFSMKRVIFAALSFAALAPVLANDLGMSFDTELGARWGGTAGKANAVWDGTRSHTTGETPSGSMKLQRSPVATETRSRIVEMEGVTSRTVVSFWFYDDGDDIKAFNLLLKTDGDKHRIGISLRDDVVGEDTHYLAEVNGVFTSSGAVRSLGWHKAEFGFTPGEGVEVRIDGKSWIGNVYIEASYPDWFQFQTDVGTGANNVWVDDIGLSIDAVLPEDSGQSSVEGWMEY